MERAALADDVVRFIENRIDSVPELEALMLLRDSAPRSWSAGEIAARIYVEPAQAAALLQNLERKKLLLAAEAGFRFREEDPDAAIFERVAAAYRGNLVAVASLIHSKSSAAVREFARAFRFKE
ncbi:MAG TPA: hypothetical protein VHE37_14590 [Nevskiaceae bacterium]|nr:hypothetical protein [Nevskiaceae bacterium]